MKLQFWTPRLAISSPVQKCIKLGVNYWWNAYSVLATILFLPVLTSSPSGCDTHTSVVCLHVDCLAPLSICSVHTSDPLNFHKSCKFLSVLSLGQLGKPPIKGGYTPPSTVPYVRCVLAPLCVPTFHAQLHNSVCTLCVLFEGTMCVPTLCVLTPFPSTCIHMLRQSPHALRHISVHSFSCSHAQFTHLCS